MIRNKKVAPAKKAAPKEKVAPAKKAAPKRVVIITPASASSTKPPAPANSGGAVKVYLNSASGVVIYNYVRYALHSVVTIECPAQILLNAQHKYH